MGKVLFEITEKEESFIASQKVFFVATAPLSKDHHVSVSPKANDGSCIVIDPHTIAYADLTGSGAETAAHVLQNQRMTLMFCNLEQGPPNILRVFGRAELELAENVSMSLLRKFPPAITQSCGFRAVYVLQVHRISTSCGYSLPIMEFTKFRNTLNEVTDKEGKLGIFRYCTLKNSYSIDGLPSLALLRKEAPPNIVPVLEDGYIFGKAVQQDKRSSNNLAQKLALQQYSAPLLTKRVYFRMRDLLIGTIVIFISGIVTGILFLSTWR